MATQFYIGEIARFFGLPASTLRYWEDMGVLNPGKNTENSYREYTVEDLMTISDVVFYKNLGIPLKQIQNMEASTPDEHRLLLEDKLTELEHQQRQLQRRMEKLRRRLSAVDALNELKKHPYQEVDIDTDCIVSFDLIERNKLRQYIENPYLYSRVQHSDHPEQERRGLTVPTQQLAQFPESQILWKKHSRTYIVCLLKEEIKEGYPNNLRKHLSFIQKSLRTGCVISRFLLCAQENGKLYDFYKTFVEILPRD